MPTSYSFATSCKDLFNRAEPREQPCGHTACPHWKHILPVVQGFVDCLQSFACEVAAGDDALNIVSDFSKHLMPPLFLCLRSPPPISFPLSLTSNALSALRFLARVYSYHVLRLLSAAQRVSSYLISRPNPSRPIRI